MPFAERNGHKNENHIELETLLTRTEFSRLMEYIGSNNIDAFITAGNVTEIYGNWNNVKRSKMPLK